MLECSAFQVPHAEGAPKRVMIVLRDITTASNYRESLVSFAGTVAHDLNNPLSVIDGWAEALEERLSESEESDAAAAAPMVQHIRVGVDQMRGFISDLLAHAVARDQSLKCEPVSLTNLVKHIVATRDRPHGGGEIIAGDLVDVWADRVLVRQVLDNLVGNAFKYVAADTVPRVLVEAEEVDDGMARVQVRDNGIGVPARPAGRDLRRLPPCHRRGLPGHRAGAGDLPAHRAAPRRHHHGDRQPRRRRQLLRVHPADDARRVHRRQHLS